MATTAVLLCEGACNDHLVKAQAMGPFLTRPTGTPVEHTVHVELAPVLNMRANVRRRQFQCVTCGTTRTFGVETLVAEAEAR